jgi:hypothetical protein
MNSKLLFSSALVASALLGSEVFAVGTRNFVLDTLESFQGGDLTGVAVSSDGTVRAGLTLAKLPIADASNVWDAVLLGDGSALLGTGSGGRVYRVQNGKASIVATTGAIIGAITEIFSTRVDDNFSIPIATAISAGPRLSLEAVTVITVKKINAANTPKRMLSGITWGCAPPCPCASP